MRTSAILTRRKCLKAGAALVLGATTRRTRVACGALRTGGAKPRPDLLDKSAPRGLEIFQITTDPDVKGCHIYMEAQIFTPDSKHFVLHRSADAHDTDRNDPRHQYLFCDIEDGFSLHPLTHEVGAAGPSVSPDGKYLYYFVDQTGNNEGPLTLKRINLDGTDRQTLLVIDSVLPDGKSRLSEVYPLSTISSDGKKLAISACTDRTAIPNDFGLLVFDLEKATFEVVIRGPGWFNMHPQFCRSTDPALRRDILIQEDISRKTIAADKLVPTDDRRGCDIHVIRDDGSNLRDMPWGRDGREFCEGHQCWRGRTGWGITSVGSPPRSPPSGEAKGGCDLIESLPVPPSSHRGSQTPGAVRNILSRDFEKPQFHHFAVDIAGRHLVTDYSHLLEEARIYLARLGEPGRDPLTDFTCLARPRPSGRSEAHMHPFLSPNGRLAFFNSDESGQLQAYAIRGLSG